MTSLRDRIAAKQRRTASFPLQVGDLGAAQAEVDTFRGALDVHLQVLRDRQERGGGEPTEADHEKTAELRGKLREAQARVADTVVVVELQALPDDEWDAILGEAPEDENGDIDLDDVRGALLAASCTDPDLQDAEWWDEQFARPEYSKGDKIAVNNALLALNLNTPDGRQGKG